MYKTLKSIQMKKIINWFKESNRWKHLTGGIALGLIANGWYCAIYAATATAAAMEYKDKAYGGKWDWIDLGLTVAGACVGRLIGVAVS